MNPYTQIIIEEDIKKELSLPTVDIPIEQVQQILPEELIIKTPTKPSSLNYSKRNIQPLNTEIHTSTVLGQSIFKARPDKPIKNVG